MADQEWTKQGRNPQGNEDSRSESSSRDEQGGRGQFGSDTRGRSDSGSMGQSDSGSIGRSDSGSLNRGDSDLADSELGTEEEGRTGAQGDRDRDRGGNDY
jgi:hypothetical protein